MAGDQRRGGHDGHPGDSVQNGAGVGAEIIMGNIKRRLGRGLLTNLSRKKKLSLKTQWMQRRVVPRATKPETSSTVILRLY